jgi:hypothetical protein
MEIYNINIHIIYLAIIFLILFKIFFFGKRKKLKEHETPTFEFYEWKRLYFKMLVLHEIKKNINKNKWRNSIINKSAFF